MTRLKTFTALGMPWHGLAQGGVLTTAAGAKAITGEGGAVVVRHPAAPGVSRSAAQQARDTAQGHTWRDYALLCGNTRTINGGPALGATRWLYCAPDGYTWVMDAQLSVDGVDVTLAIWRRDLFGVLGRGYAISDELVGEQVLSYALPPEYSGGFTAAQCAADARLDLAAQLVPNPTGASVYVHLTNTNGVYNATEVAMQGATRQVSAIVEVALSGSGDPAAGGVGVSAAFPNVDVYTDLRTLSDESLDVGDFPPTGWGECSCITDDPIPIPGFVGQTKTITTTCTTNNAGESIFHRTASGTYRAAIVYRTHLGDVTLANESYSGSVDEHEISGGVDTKETDYIVVDDGGNLVWQQQGPTRYSTPTWVSNTATQACPGPGSDRYTIAAERIQMSVGAFDFDYHWSYVQQHHRPYFAPSGCEADAWPRTLPSCVDVAEVFDSSVGALSGGMTFADLDLAGSVTIWPGYALIAAAWNNTNNDGDRHYVREFVGFGESALVNFASYSFDYDKGVQPPPTSLLIYAHAFQPVDAVGQYGLGPSAPALQYC